MTDIPMNFPSSAPAYAKQPRSAGKTVLGIVLVLVALLIVGALGLFGLVKLRDTNKVYYIPSASMTPTLNVNDKVRTHKVTPGSKIERGWIVIYNAPPGNRSSAKEVVKRVVGLPGDTIESSGGKVLVNDKPLDEPYLGPAIVTEELPKTVVPAGSYYMLGDNRANSLDSRSHGAIAQGEITHHAVQIVSPHLENLP